MITGPATRQRRERLIRASEPSPTTRRPFIGILCAYCRTGLYDRQGNPRWDVEGLTARFVCRDGCR